MKTEPAQRGQGLPGSTCSAILSMPPDARAALMTALRKPKFLARVLREEADSAEGWANRHADGASYTQDSDGKWIAKRDAYAAKAKMLRDAADVFDPPNAIGEARADSATSPHDQTL